MWLKNFLKSLPATSTRQPIRRSPRAARLCADFLEDRWVPSFGQPVEYDASLSAGIVRAADFNGDGRPDLATVNNDNTVSVLLGNGDGTFQAPRTSAGGDGSLVAADLNRDGKVDLLRLGQATTSISLLLGNGDGTFHPPQSIVLPPQLPPGWTGPDDQLWYPGWNGLDPLPQAVNAVSLGDVNGDGTFDVVATGFTGYITEEIPGGPLDEPNYNFYEFYYVSVLLGNGDGTFGTGTAVLAQPNYTTLSLLLRDVNNDGRLDVVLDGGSALGNGDGTLQNFVPSSIYVSDFSQPVIDINSDGKPDIVNLLSDYKYDGYGDVTATDRYVKVQLGNANGSFSLPIIVDFGTVAGQTAYTSAAMADFDGNGYPDLATTESFASSYDVPVVYGGVHVAFNDGNWPLPSPPPPTMTIGDATITEGNTGTRAASFTVTLSKSWDQPVTVAYATANGTATAGSDYQAVSGTLTIPAGQTTGTITVLVNGDRLGEANETFSVNLNSPTNATIADGQGVGTILDDEPRVNISDMAITEGNTGTANATFTVTLSAAYDVNVTATYATANGTATAGSDYTATSGTVTFAPGQTTKTINVPVKGDRVAEQNETFFVNLSAATNSIIADAQGVGTILDDEPRISISDVTKAEGKKNQTTLFTFTVTLSAAYDQAVTMSFKTVDGSAKTSDSDYVAQTGTLTFAPGETTKTITIVVNGDSKKESDETFYLDLSSNSSNSLFTKNRGFGTILNDD